MSTVVVVRIGAIVRTEIPTTTVRTRTSTTTIVRIPATARISTSAARRISTTALTQTQRLATLLLVLHLSMAFLFFLRGALNDHLLIAV